MPCQGLIYAVQKNIQLLTLKYLDPSTYQVVNNLKIPATGVLYKVFLKRELQRLQWLASFLLTVGSIVSQISCNETGDEQRVALGYVLAVTSACLSALAGVVTEKLL